MAHPAITRTTPDPASRARDTMWATAGRQRLMLLDRAAERARAEHAALEARARAEHAAVHVEARAELDLQLRCALDGVPVRIHPQTGAIEIVAPDGQTRMAVLVAAFGACYRRLTAADEVLADRLNTSAAETAERLAAVAQARAAVPGQVQP